MPPPILHLMSSVHLPVVQATRHHQEQGRPWHGALSFGRSKTATEVHEKDEEEGDVPVIGKPVSLRPAQLPRLPASSQTPTGPRTGSLHHVQCRFMVNTMPGLGESTHSPCQPFLCWWSLRDKRRQENEACSRDTSKSEARRRAGGRGPSHTALATLLTPRV